MAEEPRTIQLTDEQIETCKELGVDYENALSKLLTKLMFNLMEENDKRQKKYWSGLFLLAGVTEETHNLKINFVDKQLYITPRTKEE